MLRARIIPVLLLRRHGLVKTVRFKAPRYVGDPINCVRIYNEKEVDELILSEVTKSKVGQGVDFDLLEQIATEAFMPVCYGGAVRDVSDAARLLKLGIEKVSINTAAFDDPELIRKLAERFGAQCVVASVDVKKTWRGAYEVFSHAGRPVKEKDPLRWIEQLVKLGAGEVLLNAVDRDGTMRGYDLSLLQRVDGKFDVPIIACGGAGSVRDMREVLSKTRIRALGVGSRFIYVGPHNAVLASYLERNEQDELQAAARAT